MQEVHHFIMLHVAGMLSVVRCVSLLYAFLFYFAGILGASSEVVIYHFVSQLSAFNCQGCESQRRKCEWVWYLYIILTSLKFTRTLFTCAYLFSVLILMDYSAFWNLPPYLFQLMSRWGYYHLFCFALLEKYASLSMFSQAYYVQFKAAMLVIFAK